MITSTKKRLSATVYYLLTGLALSVPTFIGAGIACPGWARGDTASPLSLAVIHALFLGVMLTVACGVLYQIVPIAFQAPPVPRHVLAWHLPLHVLAVLGMLAGFLTAHWLWVGWSGTALVVLLGVYLSFIAGSYLRARNRTAVHRGLIMPMLALAGVLGVGLLQAFDPAQATTTVVSSHMLLGIAGFWVGLVLVFSYKLFPMFVISHGYKASLPRTISLYVAGVVSWLAAVWAGDAGVTVGSFRISAFLRITAALLTIAALAGFSVDMMRVWQASRRRRVVIPVYEAAVAMAVLALSGAATALALAIPWMEVVVPALYALTFGGLMALILAYVQKMVPFLWFEYRFSKRPERRTAPLIDDMVPRRPALAGWVLFGVGTLAGILACALATETEAAAEVAGWIAGICQALGTAMLWLSLRHVLTIGGPRPTDEEPAATVAREPGA
ncbi:MAG: hypothetical protein IRZ10_06725 [Thermoflavifilum sp.]|nr:hypothetical protein [Thermoflavifilum sp.]MCL6514099.1 hypothetical protein [Alicyclobacillus sp.]